MSQITNTFFCSEQYLWRMYSMQRKICCTKLEALFQEREQAWKELSSLEGGTKDAQQQSAFPQENEVNSFHLVKKEGIVIPK